MIARLRRRFILIAMLSVFAVLFVIVGGINLAGALSDEQEASRLLDMLEQGGGVFPKPGRPLMRGPGGMTPETPYETRYFTVLFHGDGTVSAVNTGSIAAVTTGEAIEYAAEVLGRGRTDGYCGVYRYRVTDRNDGRLIIFLDRSRAQLSRRNFLLTSLLFSAAGLGAVFLSVWLLSGRIVRPFAESYAKQKRFITDAGHEIKTPLAVISADAEVLEMQIGENEWTRAIRHQVDRLSELTRSLIDLARMDEQSRSPAQVPFSLSDAAEDAAEAFRPLAEVRGKRLEAEIAPDVGYTGDEQAIRRLFSILLDNAVKYAVPGDTIEFRLRRTGKGILITCTNHVESMPRGRLPQLFDRFYRGDDARSAESGGYGLGLSMAQAIVTAHRGKISARSDDGRSIVFSVWL
ncbi:MAG: sensor histidine kinase [Eubacteriales bacterium]